MRKHIDNTSKHIENRKQADNARPVSTAGVARALVAARKTKGLTQVALGKKMRLPQSHISKIEQGRTNLRVSTLLSIARLLDLELVLVPRKYSLVVRRIVQRELDDQQARSGRGEDLSQTPLYRLTP